jgi:flagellar basal body P-ring formation protein FlgA
MLRISILLAGLALVPVPALAQFADPAALDAEVAAFTGAPAGTPGGARHPVDRRLRMAACPQDYALTWHGRRAEMVRIECPALAGWQLFVPINGAASAQAAASARPASGQVVVERGQILTIALEGRGFTVTQQGEALEEGAIGDWIRVRPESAPDARGRSNLREPIRARIEYPGRAVIPVG